MPVTDLRDVRWTTGDTPWISPRDAEALMEAGLMHRAVRESGGSEVLAALRSERALDPVAESSSVPNPPPTERPIVMPEPQPAVMPYERVGLDHLIANSITVGVNYEGTQRIARAIDIFLFRLEPVRQPQRITVYIRPVDTSRRRALSAYVIKGVRFPGVGYDAIKDAFVTELRGDDTIGTQMERVVEWAKFLLKLSKCEFAAPPRGVEYGTPTTFMQRYAAEHGLVIPRPDPNQHVA